MSSKGSQTQEDRQDTFVVDMTEKEKTQSQKGFDLSAALVNSRTAISVLQTCFLAVAY